MTGAGRADRMRITLLALGSRGDVQPILALARALQADGYATRLATHGTFGPLARDAGVDFAPVEGNPLAIVQDPSGRAWLETGRNPLAFARGFRDLMGPVLETAMRDGLKACRDADALLFSGPAYYIGYSIAEKLEIPYLQAYLQPVHATQAFPSALFPLPTAGVGPLNYASHIVGGSLLWQLLLPAVNRARAQHLGLPPLSRMGPFPEMLRRRLPVLYGFSPAVLPKPRDWPDFLHVVGYWFLDAPEWRPRAELEAFLSAGEPPVCVGFGSMADRDPERITGIVVAALQRSGRRGILLSGWGGLAQRDLPASILKIDAAPHAWLMPRSAAVVHHGGAGTTAAGLRAGRPTVVVPFFGDQSFWGERVRELGAGPAPIPRKRLDVETLASAIRTATEDRGIADRAARLGERIRAEDGLGRAVAVIRAHLGPPDGPRVGRL